MDFHCTRTSAVLPLTAWRRSQSMSSSSASAKHVAHVCSGQMNRLFCIWVVSMVCTQPEW